MLITVEVNGTEYEVKEGEYILQICRKLGVFVPHLCYLQGMHPSGKCGLCVVEIDDGRVALSCITQVKSGMKIKTSSERLTDIRRNNIARMLQNHRIDCFHCSKAGLCKLQTYGFRLNSKMLDAQVTVGKNDLKAQQIKLLDGLYYDKSKCVYCTRCVKFLSEICGIKLTFIESIAKVGKTADLMGNIIDICPTAALTQRDLANEPMIAIADKKKTFDVSCVFTPEISVYTRDNKVVNISNIDFNWIRDSIKFVGEKLGSRKSVNNPYDEIIEKIATDIKSNLPEKKVFILGDNIDILTFSCLKYMASNLDNVCVALDDYNVPKDIIKDIGLLDQNLSMMDYAIFVGNSLASDEYYVKRLANNLKGTASLKFRDLNKFVSSKAEDVALFSCNFPYMFVHSAFFREHDKSKVLHLIEKIKTEYSEVFKKNLNVRIMPATQTQMLARYLKDYMSIDELLEKFNQHDVKFIFIVGDIGYKSDYNDIPTIQIAPFDDPRQKRNEYIQSKHFLEESGFYVNVFGEIVKTKKVLDSDVRSNVEFVFDLMSAIYGEDFQDVTERVKEDARETFLNRYNV